MLPTTANFLPLGWLITDRFGAVLGVANAVPKKKKKKKKKKTRLNSPLMWENRGVTINQPPVHSWPPHGLQLATALATADYSVG
jgi:hypothetical protein